MLAARVDRLPTSARQLLQAAAVLGKDIAFFLLQAIAGLPEAALQQDLTHLLAAGVLYETGFFPDRTDTFNHALTQEVAYDSLPQERRRALHARIVEAIDPRLAISTVLGASGDSRRILAALREAETLAEALGDPNRLGQVSQLLSSQFYLMGAYDQALATAQRALALATAGGNTVMQAIVNEYIGVTYRPGGTIVGRSTTSSRPWCRSMGRGAARVSAGFFSPLCSRMLTSLGPMPSWGCSPRAGSSGRKGSELPRWLVSLEASWLPRGGSECYSSAKATCRGVSACLNGPWSSVRIQAFHFGSPG